MLYTAQAVDKLIQELDYHTENFDPADPNLGLDLDLPPVNAVEEPPQRRSHCHEPARGLCPHLLLGDFTAHRCDPILIIDAILSSLQM